MFRKAHFLPVFAMFFIACGNGFEKFVPPSNSISGRGAKAHPKILTSTPSSGSTVSPNTGSTGTQIKVVFDMTMRTDTTPVINTYVRDIDDNSQIAWFPVANSGTTFTWSSTNYANDTLTIQLGWVRWPESNIIGFDFDNDTLLNLDDMNLDNSDKLYFTASWTTERYKTVPTGQYQCFDYSGTAWEENCTPAIPSGAYDNPAGQNTTVEPMTTNIVTGRRFPISIHPQNLIALNCTGNSSDPCYPYSIDSITTLVWKTCSQGQPYDAGATGQKCLSSGNDFTWGNAVNACASMNTANGGQGYAGRKDWRLPTVHELESLVDYGAKTNFGSTGFYEMPTIHGYHDGGTDPQPEGPFPDTPTTTGYWTASGGAMSISGQTYNSNAWVVEFRQGHTAIGGSSSLLKSTRVTSNRHKVRCVAGPDAPQVAQNLTASTLVDGAGGSPQPLATTTATFTAFDSTKLDALSAKASYDRLTDEHSVLVTFNAQVNTVSGGVPANYRLCAGTDSVICGAALMTVQSATVSTTNPTVTLKFGAGNHLGANTPYRLFITGVTVAPQLSAVAAAGAHSFTLTSGANSGKTVIVHGNGVNTTSLFSPTSNTTSSGVNLSANAGAGAHAFAITTGAQIGNTLVVHGGAVNTTSLYDPTANTFTAGPNLSATAGTGAHAFAITSGAQSGKTLVVHGNGVNTTSLYDPATNTFSAGPTLSGNASNGAHAFAITSGAQSGKTLVVHGNGLTTTSLYDPGTNLFGAGPALSGNASNGAHAFAIASGAQSGKTLVVHGNTLSTTSLYDPGTNLFGGGPALSATAAAGAHSFSIASGPQSGKTLVVHGNNTTVSSLYDPAANTFSSGPVLSVAAAIGAHAFAVTSGPQSGKTVSVSGNSASTTSLYDPTLHTFMPLTNSTILFSGAARVASPAATTVFNVASAASTSTTTVEVTFDQLPHPTQASVAGNYKIIATNAVPFGYTAAGTAATAVTLSGYKATLTVPALTAGTAYAVALNTNIKYLGSQIITDSVNGLTWQRCRKGLYDDSTCTDPTGGSGSNGLISWNDGLNYCNNLNAIKYGGFTSGWRAPTINELKSISNRSLFGTVGQAIDQTLFPNSNTLVDYISSTSRVLNGTPSTSASNEAWTFRFFEGSTVFMPKDYASLSIKPFGYLKMIRCVR